MLGCEFLGGYDATDACRNLDNIADKRRLDQVAPPSTLDPGGDTESAFGCSVLDAGARDPASAGHWQDGCPASPTPIDAAQCPSGPSAPPSAIGTDQPNTIYLHPGWVVQSLPVRLLKYDGAAPKRDQ